MRDQAVCWQNLEKPWEGKQRGEAVFSQDAWPSLSSGAWKAEAKNGHQNTWGQEVCGKSLYLLLNFAGNLTLL